MTFALDKNNAWAFNNDVYIEKYVHVFGQNTQTR